MAQGDVVEPLGWEDPLEQEMATHSSILVWEITWIEAPGGLLSIITKELDMTEQLTTGNNLLIELMERSEYQA